MQQSPRYNIRYPELTDQVSAFPPDVAAQNALLLDQVIGSLTDTTTEALAGKAPTSHTHSMGQVTGLDTALAGKAPTSHTHTMGQVTGLDTALAGKAPTSHTHTMGQVTGLDTALAGKANATTLDTRVPSTLALRLDTTVGTRIFAGNTMVYGDTGWRDITDLYASTVGETGPLEMGTGAKILIRRTTGDVYFRLLGPITARAANGSIVQLLTGWRPEVDTQVALSNIAGIRHSRYWISLERATPAATLISASRSVVGQWPTLDPWPTTLPGLPA